VQGKRDQYNQELIVRGNMSGDANGQQACSNGEGSAIEYPRTISLLKRLQEDFPVGVPFLAPEQLWFVFPSPAGNDSALNLTDAETQLLRQAVEKGLNRAWSDTRLLVVKELSNYIKIAAPNRFIIILLGVSDSAEVSSIKEQFPKERVIQTISLQEILQDQSNKRIFWEAIKALAL
jgi:hypothetical protein